MRSILITGGANGLGKGLALQCLAKGARVIAVGNSVANGESFFGEAKKIGAEERAVFIQADLSLTSENRRIADEIKKAFSALDALVFCASRHCKEYSETAEGLEFSFALDYLSRFILAYGLKECLEKASSPVIMNICGTGMKGDVNWDDMQHNKGFDPLKVMMHGSRLNDLSGVEFARRDNIRKIKYILYNPMAVKTPGMMEFGNAAMRLYYKLAAKPIDKAVIPIAALLDDPPDSTISAFKERKCVSMRLPMHREKNAIKLFDMTTQLLGGIERKLLV